MDRPYFKSSLDEIERLVQEHKHQRVVLAQIREELQHRDTHRAKQLLREVQGILDGEVRLPPRRPRAAEPEDQIDLIDETD